MSTDVRDCVQISSHAEIKELYERMQRITNGEDVYALFTPSERVEATLLVNKILKSRYRVLMQASKLKRMQAS